MDSIVVLMFIAIVFVGLLMLVIVATTLRPAKKLDVEYFEQRLNQIEALLGRKEVSAYHMAIINADKLLDTALRQKGTRGNNMGERLKSAAGNFSDLNGIWTAHKLRNRIAHEDSVSVNEQQVKLAIKTFRQGLRDLGAVR